MRKPKSTIVSNGELLVDLATSRGCCKNKRAHTQRLSHCSLAETPLGFPFTLRMWGILYHFVAISLRRWLQKLIKKTMFLKQPFLCSYLDMLLHPLPSDICQPNMPWRWYRPRKQVTWIHFTSLEKMDFQESFNWAFSLSGCQNCRWPKVIRTLPLFALDGRQTTEPTWQVPETQKWRKELILLGDQNHILLKPGGGLDRERGVLMSLKMFLNITRI